MDITPHIPPDQLPDDRSRIFKPDVPPVQLASCVGCGLEHDPDSHCAECTGVHQGGMCLTKEAILEMGRYRLCRRGWRLPARR